MRRGDPERAWTKRAARRYTEEGGAAVAGAEESRGSPLPRPTRPPSALGQLTGNADLPSIAPKRRRWPWITVSLVLLIVAGGGVAFVSQYEPLSQSGLSGTAGVKCA